MVNSYRSTNKDKKARYVKDILGLEREKINGKPLLIKVVDKGKIIYKTPSLDRISKEVKNHLSRFLKGLKEVYSKYKYPVIISPQLKKLRRNLSHQLEKRQ